MSHVLVRAQAPVPTVRPSLRVARAAVFAVVGTVLGVCAHHLVADGPVEWGRVSVAAVVMFALASVGAGRPPSLPGTLAFGGLTQAGLHVWLGAAAGHPPAHAPAALAGATHGADAHAAGHTWARDSLTMTAGHVLAATLVAVLLHHADAACWAVWRLYGAARSLVGSTVARLVASWRLAGRLPWPEPGSRTGRLGGRRAERAPPACGVLADVVVRRGPPGGLALQP
ncbi:hypothetical protein [Streptomyces hainanensis]|uniref:Uncharacterized protein n=1 Tax=Streptomyces hainanensis TaxID=402648 RepID=A0A4R4SHS0_9ACTN|nr:hypothetical protein [Streptomyces hainanensis]TDC61839.1 hypothetical protein E1283_35050 [Streptomyces hainanensis]